MKDRRSIGETILAFRCAYCNCYNKSRKQKPVFQGDIVAHDPPSSTINSSQNQFTTEPMDVSSDSPDSIKGTISFLHLSDQFSSVI